jgi:hypothetical protein
MLIISFSILYSSPGELPMGRWASVSINSGTTFIKNFTIFTRLLKSRNIQTSKTRGIETVKINVPY